MEYIGLVVIETCLVTMETNQPLDIKIQASMEVQEFSMYPHFDCVLDSFTN